MKLIHGNISSGFLNSSPPAFYTLGWGEALESALPKNIKRRPSQAGTQASVYGVQCVNHRVWDGMGWCSHKILKERKKGKRRERKKKEILCLAMLAWIPIIYLSKEFLKHSIASFLLLKQRWHIPCRSLPKHKSSTKFSFSSRRKKSVRYEYQPL